MRYVRVVAPELSRLVAARIHALNDARVVKRIWARDHTVWKPDPTEITNRLAWLSIADDMEPEVPALEEFAREAAADGLRHALLLGMGGSSLGPEVIRECFGVAAGRLDLVVLDSTDPRQVRETEARLDLGRTLVLVASKSGTTIETISQMDYFWERIGNPAQFVAKTDPGSPLDMLARERGFRRVFAGHTEIGGRFSVLSSFGLVPAALIGAPIERLLADARAMALRCHADDESNPGLALGITLAEAALAGRDKCTFFSSDDVGPIGPWVEQLVAESTGKEGKGIVPIVGEPAGLPAVYGRDRIFVAYQDSPLLASLRDAGHPVVVLAAAGLGGEFFRWEFATAVACAVLGVQPFDQPNVQEAKDSTSRALNGDIPTVQPGSPGEVLAGLRAGDYLAINAFLPRNAENEVRLASIRTALRDHFRVATTVGFGPRFLHSTGQLHKGGPASGAFIEVVSPPSVDIPVPGRPYTFGQLEAAQALGDLAALLERGRRACRVELSELESEVDRLLASEKADPAG